MYQLTNEQQALHQIITYIEQSQWDKLKFYCQIINSQHFRDFKNQKILTSLKYLYLEQQTTHPWDKIKVKKTILEELLTYLQTNFPNDNFITESLNYLNNNFDNNNNNHLLANLKHTFTKNNYFNN